MPVEKEIQIEWAGDAPPVLIVAKRFSIQRLEGHDGLLEIVIEPEDQNAGGMKIHMDCMLLRNPAFLQAQQQYLAKIAAPTSQEIVLAGNLRSETVIYSNVYRSSYSGSRAEIIFGAFTLADWASALQAKEPLVTWTSRFGVVSTLKFHRTLVSELLAKSTLE